MPRGPVAETPVRQSARVARSNALLAQVEAAKEEEKVRIAAEGLAKLLELPPKEEVSDLVDTTGLNRDKLKAYKDRVISLKESWRKFTEKRKVQTSSRDAIYELFLIETTALALLMFGPERVALWEARYGGDSRDIFEIAEPEDQCQGTAGPITYKTTLCWICGMPIYFSKDELPGKDENGHSAECEHVLPVAQAALFLQLYDKSNKSSELFELEYDWAHKTCNQTKNNDVYFKKKSSGGLAPSVVPGPDFLPEIDEVKYRAMLENVYKSTRSDAVRTKDPGYIVHKQGDPWPNKYSFRDTLWEWINENYKKKSRSVEQWKDERVTVMRGKYEAILETIRTRNYAMSPELYLLSLASATAEIINRQDLNRRPKKDETSRRRETLYGAFRPSITFAAPAAPAASAGSNIAAAVAFMAPAPAPAPAAAVVLDADITAAIAEQEAAAAASVLAGRFEELPPHALEVLEPLKLSSLQKLAPQPSAPAPALGAMSSFLPTSPRVGALQRLKPGLTQLVDIGLKLEIKTIDPWLGPPPADALPPPSAAAAAGAPAPALAELDRPVDKRILPPREAHGKVRTFGNPYEGGRRTRRRTQSFLPHRRRRTHHAIKMSSRRHSVSGMASRRRLTSSKVLSSGSSSAPSGRRVSSTRMSTKPVPHGGF